MRPCRSIKVIRTSPGFWEGVRQSRARDECDRRPTPPPPSFYVTIGHRLSGPRLTLVHCPSTGERCTVTTPLQHLHALMCAAGFHVTPGHRRWWGFSASVQSVRRVSERAAASAAAPLLSLLKASNPHTDPPAYVTPAFMFDVWAELLDNENQPIREEAA